MKKPQLTFPIILLATVINPFTWIRINVLNKHRLENLKMAQLGSHWVEAVELYGFPVEKKTVDKIADATQYIFNAGRFHQVVVIRWKDKIHSITYWSSKPDPKRDLNHIFKHYGSGMNWDTISEGYLYQRGDKKYRLWCSAMPAIGIGTNEYISFKNEINNK